ncbi:MAG: hypothetical protein GWO22_16690, partial [Actinobacteria bacterium]|nr:hypothetical protein [Actinomycetota bacterium]
MTFPETMTVSDVGRAGERRGGVASFAPPIEEGPLASELLSSLEALGLRRIADVPVHTLEEPSDPVRRRRRGAPAIPPVQEVTLTAELPQGERAVALVEQDGLYSWTFGEVEALPDDGPRPRRRGAAAPGPGTSVRFTVPLHASSAPGRRTRLLGMEHVFRPIRAFVFAFPARLVVGQVVKHLERDIDTGLLRLVRPEADGWQPLDDAASLDLPD